MIPADNLLRNCAAHTVGRRAARLLSKSASCLHLALTLPLEPDDLELYQDASDFAAEAAAVLRDLHKSLKARPRVPVHAQAVH